MLLIRYREICCFIALIILLSAYYFSDIQIFPRICDDEQFQCWFEKKQALNKNIARVCRKYGESIKIPDLQIDNEKQKREFLHYDKMVYCPISKVLIIIIKIRLRKMYGSASFSLFRQHLLLGLENSID